MSGARHSNTLGQLLVSQQLPSELAEIEVFGMTLDSRDVTTGHLFIALQGGIEHGIRYAKSAETAGAVAILSDGLEIAGELSIPVITVAELRDHLGTIAAEFYARPAEDLLLLGVTGTNGKTSVAYFLSQLLATHYQCGFMGTIGIGLPGKGLQQQQRTTPDVISMQRSMHGLKAQQCQAVALEVSSHALQQGRVDELKFELGVFTNLSHDHLDYHGSMQAYAAAKKKLFTDCGARYAVINAGDETGLRWCEELENDLQVMPYGTRLVPGMTGVFAQQLELSSTGMKLSVVTPVGQLNLDCNLLGEFNAENLLAAVAVLICLKVELAEIELRVSQLVSAPGRMESFGGKQQPLVVVDYAHTPDALQKVLQTLLQHCDGELVAVFGCGGDRDAAKRSVMGEIASRYATKVIITNDNPRSESPEQIAAEINSGVVAGSVVSTTLDRRRAIAEAIAVSQSGDCVLVAGKGHEAEQVIGTDVLPFDDRQVVKSILSERAA